jgi:hypothetical protein
MKWDLVGFHPLCKATSYSRGTGEGSSPHSATFTNMSFLSFVMGEYNHFLLFSILEQQNPTVEDRSREGLTHPMTYVSKQIRHRKHGLSKLFYGRVNRFLTCAAHVANQNIQYTAAKQSFFCESTA